jgi:hypothetical protein
MKNTIKNNTKTQLTIADATYEGGKKTLTGTVAADVFIVPNKALNMKGYCFVTDSRIKNLEGFWLTMICHLTLSMTRPLSFGTSQRIQIMSVIMVFLLR